ncbi:MAG: 16S rRNA (guanine(527)-N(7))-methyltransferase RsmG [Lachnospiraceae bacterium]|nr:16S rRNA (guanine(527)-N(7))-methyltransferase RsmG [Lachnospiraceae bacterium]
MTEIRSNRIQYIENLFLNHDVTISKTQAEKFYDFYSLLIEKNKSVNLTAITEFEEVVIKHFLDSVSLVRNISMENVKLMLDLGTGGGFPGTPIKMLYPHIDITYVDSVDKKLKFISECCEKLDLGEAKICHARAEDLARDAEYREKYDLCTSRAVADLSVLSEYCIPFLHENGIFAAYKSGDSEDEINGAKPAIKELGGKIIDVDEFEWEGMHRKIVLINKVKKTPAKYPRKAGVPKKNPLGK